MKFYDFNELTSRDNSKIVVKFHDFIDSEMFEYKMKILIEFIRKILNKVSEENCIIIKYNEIWVVNKAEAPELVNILNNNLVNNKLKGGLYVDKDDIIIELFIESVFKYNSFIQIVFKDSKLINRHLTIWIYFFNLIISVN